MIPISFFLLVYAPLIAACHVNTINQPKDAVNIFLWYMHLRFVKTVDAPFAGLLSGHRKPSNARLVMKTLNGFPELPLYFEFRLASVTILYPLCPGFLHFFDHSFNIFAAAFLPGFQNYPQII